MNTRKIKRRALDRLGKHPRTLHSVRVGRTRYKMYRPSLIDFARWLLP